MEARLFLERIDVPEFNREAVRGIWRPPSFTCKVTSDALGGCLLLRPKSEEIGFGSWNARGRPAIRERSRGIKELIHGRPFETTAVPESRGRVNSNGIVDHFSFIKGMGLI